LRVVQPIGSESERIFESKRIGASDRTFLDDARLTARALRRRAASWR